MSRIDILKSFIAANPQDPFPRYGLAMELKNQGELEQARVAFRELLEAFPDYTATYLHAGAVNAALGHKSEAAAIYRKGIEVAGRRGDSHAKGELEGALADLADHADQ